MVCSRAPAALALLITLGSSLAWLPGSSPRLRSRPFLRESSRPSSFLHAKDAPGGAKDAPGGGEDEFVEWLASSLRDAPGRTAYPAVFDSAEECVVRWRRRYHGNPSVWKCLMKDRLLKEIVECAPVIAAAQEFIATAPLAEGERFTLVDLASGKGFLSMLLSEMLPPERVERVCVVLNETFSLSLHTIEQTSA